MKIKKTSFCMAVCLILALTITACSSSKPVAKQNTIAPYQLSDQQTELLQYLNLEQSASLFQYQAPAGCTALNIRIHLFRDQKWEEMDVGGISLGSDAQAAQALSGVFVLQPKEDYVLQFDLQGQGHASFHTEALLGSTFSASSSTRLQTTQTIEPDQEIPVAILAYTNGGSLKSHSLADAADLTKFEDADLVQIVTLTFSKE